MCTVYLPVRACGRACMCACVRACACAASAVDGGGANSPDLYPRLGAREVVPGGEESDPAEQKRLPAILLQRHETNCSGAERHNLSLHSVVGTAIESPPPPQQTPAASQLRWRRLTAN